MNCGDISLILDDGDTSALGDEPRNAVDAHLAECDDCARDWKLHARLVHKKLPALPSDLVEECSALAAADSATDLPRRKWKRGAVAVSVAVLAAAAAMLTFHRVAGSGSVEVTRAPSASVDTQDRNVVVGTPSPSRSQDVLHAEVKTSPTAGNASDTFSVRLSILQDDTLDAMDVSDFNIFRTAAIDELRRTPGLNLMLAEPSTSSQRVDFEITLSAVRQNGRLFGRLDVSKSGPDRVILPIRGNFGQGCDAPSCQGAASLGESMAELATRLMMPRAPAQQSALLKELQDTSRTPQQRLEALRNLDLRNLGVHRAGLRTDPSGDSLRDPAVIRAVIDLASVAPNPEQRAEIWKTMRSIGNPALIEPLARAAQLDPDISVRAEAVATLAADYARDPRSRAALELIARGDSHSMVRALAESGLSGEAAWKSYVRSSLEDTTLPDAQRLEAVLYQLRSLNGSTQPLANLLDDDAINALAQVLPKADSTGTDVYGVTAILTRLVSLKHPAITSMLLASVDRRDPRFDRRLVMNMLAERVAEPDVRAALERVAEVDPDEQSREIAKQALQDNK